MSNKIFIQACRNEKTSHTPVWYMRQAGRCIPDYRKIREKYDVITISKTPEIAAEVTLQPVKKFGVDAAILFADIMIPLISLGVDLQLVDSVGPVINNPIKDKSDILSLKENHPEKDYAYLRETIGLIKSGMSDDKAVIGFCGAPFTLASYLIEGKPTRDFIKTKKFMYEQSESWHILMNILTDAMIAYLKEQVKAGIDAYQIFDSWIGFLSRSDFIEYALPYSSRIFEALKETGLPGIHFGTNSYHFLKEFSSVDCDVVSLDWRYPISDAWEKIGCEKAVQGNLDPAVLTTNMDIIKKKVDEIFDDLPKREGYIFNLGHGIVWDTPFENIVKLTEYVQSK